MPDIHARLELAESKLDLITTIDAMRDSARDPSTMLSSIVNTLSDRFEADLCMIALIDRDLGHLEMKAINDREGAMRLLGTETIRALAVRTLTIDEIAIWEGPKAFEEAGMQDPPDNLHVAAVPIIMGSKLRLGTLLLIRDGEPFSERERDLLHTAENHIDSAIIQGYDFYELHLRNREIETIYRVDRIRDENMSFDEMLTAVLDELRRTVPAEMGFIMLTENGDLEMRAVSHDDLFRLAPYQHEIVTHSERALREARMVVSNELPGDLRSILCIPLILRNHIIGVVGLANRYRPAGFDEADRRLLTAIGSQMDTAIFEGLEQRRLRQVLGRSVDPKVMERLLENPDVGFLRGERRTLTVLYGDMRDSTGLATVTDPELLVGYVNDYLGAMADIIIDHQATLDKFVGDEVMALFGAPFPMEDHALVAVRVALEMQRKHRSIMAKWSERGVETRPIGVGIASGELIVGEMGSAQRTDYTVLGPAANLGARLCSAASGGEVLLAPETYTLIKDDVDVEPLSGMSFKGIGDDITVYRLLGLK